MTVLTEAVRAALEVASTATVSTQLLKRGIRSVYMQGVRPLSPGQPKLIGEAYTMRYVPMREDVATLEILGRPDNPQRVAIEECPAGAVLVMDGCGRGQVGTLGEILAERLKQRHVAGVVSDGGVRDAAGCIAVGLPIWCAGPAAPANVVGLVPADRQVPVGCGEVTVFPGDVIVADGDGVVVIPRAIAAEVAEGAAEQERLEIFIHARVKGGAALPGTYPPNEATLAAYRAARGDAE